MAELALAIQYEVSHLTDFKMTTFEQPADDVTSSEISAITPVPRSVGSKAVNSKRVNRYKTKSIITNMICLIGAFSCLICMSYMIAYTRRAYSD